jgi:hypothetical protein
VVPPWKEVPTHGRSGQGRPESLSRGEFCRGGGGRPQVGTGPEGGTRANRRLGLSRYLSTRSIRADGSGRLTRPDGGNSRGESIAGWNGPSATPIPTFSKPRRSPSEEFGLDPPMYFELGHSEVGYPYFQKLRPSYGCANSRSRFVMFCPARAMTFRRARSSKAPSRVSSVS